MRYSGDGSSGAAWSPRSPASTDRGRPFADRRDPTDRRGGETAERGVVGLVQFSEEDDPDYRHASIDIFVDARAHRRGIATDALTTLVEYLCDQRGHHRLTIDPAADNAAAIACYEKVGFRPVGVMRAYERQANGTWGDGLLMDLLRTYAGPRSVR